MLVRESFPLIRGWDEGVAGMQVGGRRQLRVPPELAYGSASAAGGPPPNSMLIYDVALLGVQ